MSENVAFWIVVAAMVLTLPVVFMLTRPPRR
jgi:hypothetical protein